MIQPLFDVEARRPFVLKPALTTLIAVETQPPEAVLVGRRSIEGGIDSDGCDIRLIETVRKPGMFHSKDDNQCGRTQRKDNRAQYKADYCFGSLEIKRLNITLMRGGALADNKKKKNTQTTLICFSFVATQCHERKANQRHSNATKIRERIFRYPSGSMIGVVDRWSPIDGWRVLVLVHHRGEFFFVLVLF